MKKSSLKKAATDKKGIAKIKKDVVKMQNKAKGQRSK